MNPDTPKNPREELEVRVTALLMGELSDEEAAALREKIAADPALAALHARLGQVVGLLREASADAGGPAPPNRCGFHRGGASSFSRISKRCPPGASAAARRDWRPFIQLGLAAALVALIGGSLMMPTLSLVQHKSEATRDLYSTVDELAAIPEPASPAPEAATEDYVMGMIKPPASATDAAAERWRWESQPGAIRPTRVLSLPVSAARLPTARNRRPRRSA